MASSEYEGNINGKLCDILKKELNAKKEVKIGRKRIDILIEFEMHKIAIECETHGRNKEKAAILDAESRLYPNALVDSAVAVVYPQDCTENNLTLSTTIQFAFITKNHVLKKIQQTRLNTSLVKQHVSKRIKWHKRTIKQLMIMLKNTPRDMGDPSVLVSDLTDALSRAVSKLPINKRKSISMSLGMKQSNTENEWVTSAKRALLVVASASLFHARLEDHLSQMQPHTSAITKKPFKGKWAPKSLNACYNSNNVIIELLNTWILILHVDYKPIFEASRTVLESTSGHQFEEAVKDVVDWARKASSHVEALRHDMLGRIFHVVLEDARYDGSFYTSVPSAVLLAGLAIRNRKDIPTETSSFKVIDPACGTGTLLMAIAERIRNINPKYNEKAIIEDVLHGVDINVTALHMAATTLGLLSPTTHFSNMKIWKAEFGRVNTVNKIAAGSLELYEEATYLPFELWTKDNSAKQEYATATHQIESGERQRSENYKNMMDIVIMNPPFTRHDIRHEQLGEQVKKLVKEREQKIFKNSIVKPDKTSSGLMFLILGEYLVNENGTFAFVFPASVATAPSASSVRKFLAKKFHIEYVITSHDPKRYYFSENTRISEILVIMRRIKSSKPTKFINLAVNPNTSSGAEFLVEDILKNRARADLQTIEQPQSRMKNGDWSCTQFFSSFLIDVYYKIIDGKLFPIKHLCDVADIGPNGRTIVMSSTRSDVPDPHGWRTIYGHETERITTIENKPYAYLIPKPDKLNEANIFWKKRATLLLPERLQPNITHVSAIKSTMPTIGASWTPVRPFKTTSHDSESWSKAMAVYFNSTIGIIAILGVRIPRKLLYPRYSLNDCQRIISIPVLSSNQIKKLAKIYDKYSKHIIGFWKDPNDNVRISFDMALCDILNLDKELITRIREELSREPMCTGKQYMSD